MMDVWTSLAISAATTLGVALAVLFGVWLFVRIAGKRLSWLADGYRAIRPRLRVFVVTLALNISFQVVEVSPEQWWDVTRQMFVILVILSLGFLVQATVNFAFSQFGLAGCQPHQVPFGWQSREYPQ